MKCLRKIYHYLNGLKLYFYKKAHGIPSDVILFDKIYLDAKNVKFGNRVTIYPGAQIWGPGKILIGDNVAIGKDTIILGVDEIVIGNDVSIAAQSYIIDCDHGYMKKDLIRNQKLNSAPIFIGNDVWIGAGAKVLKGSYISEGAVIGAMGLVKGYIDPYSINVGIPVKNIGERK